MVKVDKYELPGGATRSERAPGYHLVPNEGFRRIAMRSEYGAMVHGDFNWLRALLAKEDAVLFCREAYNHMQAHMLKALEGDASDDHLGAIGWGACAIATAEKRFGRSFWCVGPLVIEEP